MFKKIVSGGQTGADRVALDVAIKFKVPHGGWIPKGRLTEDGSLPEQYQLQEMPTDSYPKRTEQNVIDSDGTLILSHEKLASGSAYTRKMAKKHNKPHLHINLNKVPEYHAVFLVRKWMYENEVEILNVAGPRASKDPQIYGGDKGTGTRGTFVQNVHNFLIRSSTSGLLPDATNRVTQELVTPKNRATSAPE